jgi:hypothetical protein
LTRNAFEWRVDSVPLMPLSAGPFSLQLVLSGASAASDDPFLLLSEEDDFARVYLAVIKGDSESVVDFCAIKLMRNVYRAGGLGDDAALSNALVEERWAFEAEQIRNFRAAARMAPRLVVPDTGSESGMLPPLFYCRTGRRFFTPPCPRCGAALATCRDDALLARLGLPLFGSSLDRFLYCAGCSAEDPEVPLYAFEGPATPEHKLVLPAADLYRDLGEALAGGVETEQIRAGFPCPDCLAAAKKFQTALGSGLRAAPFWEDRWTPLNFYDSPVVVTGFGALSLDELSDMLGGRPRESFAEEAAFPPALSEAARYRYPVGGELSASTGRLLFEADGSGMDAVEVLYLKIVAFRQVVEGALEYARAFGRPHLDLHPRHVFFDLARSGEGLPWLWGFQARLHGLSSAARSQRLAGAADILIPPRKPSVPYAPPEVLEFHLAPPRPAQLVLTELELAGGGVGRFRLHGKLSDPYGIYPAPREQDWILVTLDNEALGLSNAAFPSRRDPRAALEAQELEFISEPVVLEEATAQRLKKTTGGRISGARYKVYADFGAPSDLFSLGMMLLKLLAGNDRQDAKAIAEAVERIAKRLSAGDDAAALDLDALTDQDPKSAAVFQKSNVLYQGLDRAENRPNAIPDATWNRAVLLGLRLATRVDGFSLCADPSDYDAVHPTAKLETAAQEVDLLAAELRCLLFQRQAMHMEIQQLLSELASEGSRRSGKGSGA